MTYPLVGETCLHQAASSGDGTSIKMLLAAGANPDIQCAKSGKTGNVLIIHYGVTLYNWFLLDTRTLSGSGGRTPGGGGVTVVLRSQPDHPNLLGLNSCFFVLR